MGLWSQAVEITQERARVHGGHQSCFEIVQFCYRPEASATDCLDNFHRPSEKMISLLQGKIKTSDDERGRRCVSMNDDLLGHDTSRRIGMSGSWGTVGKKAFEYNFISHCSVAVKRDIS